jgi:UrcA family protein
LKTSSDATRSASREAITNCFLLETIMYSDTKTRDKIFRACTAAVMSLMCTGVVAIAFIPKETVKFQDLNINSSAGAAALYQRLHAAARHVCFAEWDRDPVRVQRAEDCANEAESRAVSQLNVAELTAYYQIKGRQDLTLTADLAK